MKKSHQLSFRNTINTSNEEQILQRFGDHSIEDIIFLIELKYNIRQKWLLHAVDLDIDNESYLKIKHIKLHQLYVLLNIVQKAQTFFNIQDILNILK